MFRMKNIALLLSISIMTVTGVRSETIPGDSLVQKFYSAGNQPLYWFSSGKSIRKAAEWLSFIESADKSAQVAGKGDIKKLQAALKIKNRLDNTQKLQTDRNITGLILNYLKVLQEGTLKFDYDEVSVPRDSLYCNQLLSFKRREKVSDIAARLECKDSDYVVLKKYLKDSVASSDTMKYKTVLLAMNFRKYLIINNKLEYVLVNIPEAEARYYRNGFFIFRMRTVVGSKKYPTPRISSYITSIVTFPYWNVPHNIAVKELLPKVQKNENYLEQNNFEIVDAKGNQIEDSELDWAKYNENNFPYYFRQATGEDNSLGVLKFNLRNPFSIFLHSTSVQSTFKKDFRFLSHGCIRLEKPFDLAIALLRGNIDMTELKSGKKEIEPRTLKLPARVPVFIVYIPLKVDGNKVTFLKDNYGLIQ